jgi:hypothetical protein
MTSGERRACSEMRCCAATHPTGCTLTHPRHVPSFSTFRCVRVSLSCRWLNSKLGLGDSALPPPFTPVAITSSDANNSVALLGKSVTVGDDGLLARVDVASDPNAPGLVTAALAAPVRFDILIGGVAAHTSVTQAATLKPDAHGRSVSWEATWSVGAAAGATTGSAGAAALSASVSASLDFSGYADYVVTLNASSSSKVDSVGVELVIPMAVENTHFALGLSRPGGLLSTWFTNRSGCCCDTPRCQNGPFEPFVYLKMLIYQDRRGTNIGKALKNRTVFPQVRLDVHARSAALLPAARDTAWLLPPCFGRSSHHNRVEVGWCQR